MAGNIEIIYSGQVLFDFGNKIDKCFILQRGVVRIRSREGELLSSIAPNTMFGFTELLAGKSVRETRAVCESAGSVVSFSSEILQDKLAEFDAQRKQLLEQLAAQIIQQTS
ncbi:MAG: Crp/Fnr family transcriptional regulator [Alphaproteobacteria bacterium]|nr:Crp/Fnr family transcriptional regulator [Alphaproteobacteria bacterium]